MAGVVALDAGVLIAHLDASDPHHDAARTLLGDHADEDLVASALTVAEVLVGPARVGALDAATAALRRIEVRSVGLDAAAAVRLARSRAATRLRLPDCCVLLVAEEADATVATFDRRLAASARSLGHHVVPS